MQNDLLISLIILAIIIIQFVFIIILVVKTRRSSQENVLLKLAEYDQKLDKNEVSLRDEFGRNREETNKSARESREELSSSLKSVEEKLLAVISNFNVGIDNKIKNLTDSLDSGLKFNRDELSSSMKSFREESSAKIEALTKDTKDGLEKNRDTLEKKLADIQKQNEEKLEQMRVTVDEKLHDTLEKRLNESFQTVSSQLQSVYKGLGEMQTLASGVGDLKKVLSNVQSRGNLGEIQLGAILEQILSPEQYAKQYKIKETSNERVDYVIKLPNKNDQNMPLLLPIDSKFPNEDYVRLVEAYENMADKSELEAVSKQFESTVRDEAKKISSKYIDTPRTTPFALMFVPTEGLFAEIVRRTALFESLRREMKITVVGPTNLAAFLSSLQMGFDTLAIQKRTSDVWNVLKAVNTSFRKFGEALASTKKKLISATNEIEIAESKSRTLERKLNSVEKLSVPDSINLPLEIDADETDETE
jgi:DNA recombination protein RmuC